MFNLSSDFLIEWKALEIYFDNSQKCWPEDVSKDKLPQGHLVQGYRI